MAWNKPIDQPEAEPKKKPTAWRGAVAGGVVALAAIVAAVVIFSGGDAKPKVKAEKRSGEIKSVKAIAGKTTAANQSPTETGLPKTRLDQVAADSPTVVSNAVAETVDEPGTIRQKPVFSNACDALIAQVLAGGDIPPLPMLGPEYDARFREALKREIPVSEDDTPEIKAMKEKVRDCRQQILELMDNGAHFADILNEHRSVLSENATTRTQCEIELHNLVESGDIEGAKKYYFKVNLALQQMGIEEMKKPTALMDEAELEAYRKERWEFFHGEGRRLRQSQGTKHYK